MLLAELFDDDTCAYALLGMGSWHFFGPHLVNAALSTPLGSALYSFVVPFIA